MHITVAGKQVDTGDALKTHVRDGLGAIAKKYFDHALEANVTFRRDAKGRLGAFNCDINLKAGRNLFVRGEGEGPDAHRAFEVAAEHVAKRLRRYRRRVNDHARSLAEERADAAETAPEYVVSQADGEDAEEDGASRARRRREWRGQRRHRRRATSRDRAPDPVRSGDAPRSRADGRPALPQQRIGRDQPRLPAVGRLHRLDRPAGPVNAVVWCWSAGSRA